MASVETLLKLWMGSGMRVSLTCWLVIHFLGMRRAQKTQTQGVGEGKRDSCGGGQKAERPVSCKWWSLILGKMERLVPPQVQTGAQTSLSFLRGQGFYGFSLDSTRCEV